jgi:hypothetical protein
MSTTFRKRVLVAALVGVGLVTWRVGAELISPSDDDSGPSSGALGWRTRYAEPVSDFVARVRRIARVAVDETSYADSVRPVDFQEALRAGDAFAGVAYRTLLEEELTRFEVSIVLLLAQGMSSNQYIEFLVALFGDVRRQRLTDDRLRFAIFPDPEWCTTIEKHHADERVRRLLRSWQTAWPGDREYVDYIISGRRWSDTQAGFRSGELVKWM